VLNKRGGPNKRGGLADFFVYYMKNNGEGENFSVYYMKNKGRVSKFLKLNKRVYPFIRDLRVLITVFSPNRFGQVQITWASPNHFGQVQIRLMD
jgi:hypothetical protein